MYCRRLIGSNPNPFHMDMGHVLPPPATIFAIICHYITSMYMGIQCFVVISYLQKLLLVSMGVPIAAWPMHSDQPRNAVVIAELLKVGLIVKECAHREAIIESSAIKEAVRRLMAS